MQQSFLNELVHICNMIMVHLFAKGCCGMAIYSDIAVALHEDAVLGGVGGMRMRMQLNSERPANRPLSKKWLLKSGFPPRSRKGFVNNQWQNE